MRVCAHTHAYTHLRLHVIASLRYTGIYMHECTRFAEASHFMYANQSIFWGRYGPEWSFPLQDCITNPYVACFLTFYCFIFHV